MQMKAKLRDLVKFDGIMTQNVELVAFDWGRQLAFLPDGRWVSVGNVVVGDPFEGDQVDATSEFEIARTYQALANAAKRVGSPAGPPLLFTCACGKMFTGPKAAQSLGGHRRHCKGLPA